MMAYKTISWTIERENISCFSCKFLMLIFQICYFSISLIFPTLIVACTFPVLLIIVKAMLIINNGKELKKLGYIMTLSEGQMESFCQLGLQLYIIMEKPDRHPSNVQLFALEASILTLIMVQVNTYFAKNPLGFMDDLKRKLFIFPVFLLKNAFILGTSAFVASVSPTAFVINVSIYCAIILLIGFFRTTCTMFGAKKYICSNVFIGIIFFLYPLCLLAYATYISQERYYFYGNISSLLLDIILIVTGIIYAILASLTAYFTSEKSRKMTLLYPIHV